MKKSKKLPADIVGMHEFRGKLLIATKKGVYELSEPGGKIKKLKLDGRDMQRAINAENRRIKELEDETGADYS